MRYFFEIQYHGANYSGWQSQENAIGVQAVVEEALSKMFRTPIQIVGSGRTDAGVHCEQQFFHADIESPFEIQKYYQKINSFLPRDIAIPSIRKVTHEANARYDAIERVYQYRITLIKNPFLQGLAWHFFKPLDVQTMNDAAALLLGEQDFECFSKVKTDVNHFICDIKQAHWHVEESKLEFTIAANRFLRGMVRAIVGTLIDIGTGKTSVADFNNILHSRDRRKAGANVPAHGLYLVQVKYPEGIFLDE
jgi:tRNA pseudouridine38-40 synthase